MNTTKGEACPKTKKRTCAEPRCPKFVSADHRFCPTHRPTEVQVARARQADALMPDIAVSTARGVKNLLPGRTVHFADLALICEMAIATYLAKTSLEVK